MTRKSRTILFFSLVFLFFLSTLTGIFYSLGYRFDFKNKKFTQTGAFYTKVLPKNAEIYINGEFKKKTDFLFGQVFIKNLLPKTYKIEIKKDGYFTWGKILEIKEKQVTEAKNVVLIPKNHNFNILSKEVKDFWFFPKEKIIIFKKGDGKNWTLSLYDLKRGNENYLISGKDLQRTGINLVDLEISPDSEKILLKISMNSKKISIPDVERKKQIKYYILDITKTPYSLTSLDVFGKEIQNLSFKPGDPQKIFYLKEGQIFEGNLVQKKSSPPFLKKIISYQIFERNIYYLENSGFLFKTDFSFSLREKINEIPFSLKKGGKYKIHILGREPKIFLQEGEVFYLFNPETKSFEKFSETVKGLVISPDKKKMVYFNDYEIWILFLTEITEQPPRKSGEKVFLSRFSQKIDQVFWYTDHYLIFTSGNKIIISEIDNRDVINIATLAQFGNPKIFFDRERKKIYILSHENLYSSEKLF